MTHAGSSSVFRKASSLFVCQSISLKAVHVDKLKINKKCGISADFAWPVFHVHCDFFAAWEFTMIWSEVFGLVRNKFCCSQALKPRTPMKISPCLVLLLSVASAFAEDAMKFVSPDKSSTLVIDKSGKRDLIELKSGKRVHRLFYEDVDSIFKPRIAEAFNASLNKVGKIVLPTFTSARWTSAEEVEIKGESSVIINDDDGDEFTFTASVSKSGSVKHLIVVPTK